MRCIVFVYILQCGQGDQIILAENAHKSAKKARFYARPKYERYLLKMPEKMANLEYLSWKPEKSPTSMT